MLQQTNVAKLATSWVRRRPEVRRRQPTRPKSLDVRVNARVDEWAARYGLKAAETDVLRRAALGETRADIAEARGSANATIKKHITNLLQLTGDETFQAALLRLLREVA